MRWRLLTVPAVGIAVICQLSLTGSAGTSTALVAADQPGAVSIAPNPVNEMDCNGHSKAYKTVRPQSGMLCTDMISINHKTGQGQQFDDNGWYIGHDEPSIRFLSDVPGSATTMTYYAKIPVDPKAAATASGSVTDYAELSVAPWFGLPLCDPQSYPQNPCKPDSDSNSGQINNPKDAGDAFMELQLYPPGYTPFIDNVSCSATKWCAAMTIDSAECSFAFFYCNPNCPEPVNFAWLQTNGVPAGPPSPQRQDASTYTPNAHTLLINPGDVIQVSITDPSKGFTTTIHDRTTGQTGWMTASAANGFMNSNLNTCNGTPFTFHAEYSTATAGAQVPWAALTGGVLMEQEIGHSEICGSLANQDPFALAYPDGSTVLDPDVYDSCVGGSDAANDAGEGPCTMNSAFTDLCTSALTQGPSGPVGCANSSSTANVHCEFADGACFPQGSRTAFVDGNPVTYVSGANLCLANRFQNGDLDYDGADYVPFTWPNGTSDHPTSFQYVGPFMASGQPYPQLQFETDASGSANLCNVGSGRGCVLPPTSAKFYPYWSLSPSPSALGSKLTSCVWNFGGNLPNTVANFGGDAQYGAPDTARFGGTNLSAVLTNPEFSGSCSGARYR
jgi:hypothetical protein